MTLKEQEEAATLISELLQENEKLHEKNKELKDDFHGANFKLGHIEKMHKLRNVIDLVLVTIILITIFERSL